MSFEKFHDGRRGGHIGYRNETILAILNIYVTLMLPLKFRLNPTYGLRGDVVWRISRWSGGHLGYRNGAILVMLYAITSNMLYVAPMPPIKFWLNPTYGFWRCRLKNFKMVWRPSWISERCAFGNAICYNKQYAVCRSDASHQVLAQSDLRFWEMSFEENYKMAAMTAILDIGTERF